MSLAMSGRIDKQIASEMGISLGTVRVYWKRIRQKVGGTRSEVIAELARNSLKLDFDGQRDRAEQLANDLEMSAQRERRLRVFEAAFQILPTPLAILDGPIGRIVGANGPFAELHGFEIDELEDLPSAVLMEPAEVVGFEKKAQAAAAEGQAFETKINRRRKDGSSFVATATVSGDGDNTWVLALQA